MVKRMTLIERLEYARKHYDAVICGEAKDEIERLTAESSALRDAVEDFIAQIADCKSHHTVCSQLTTLVEVAQKNLAAVQGDQDA